MGQPRADALTSGIVSLRPPDERRAGDRHPIDLEVSYKRRNTFFADYTRNVSKGGTFVATERPLEIGRRLVFTLRVPGLAEPFRLRGTVVWSVAPADASPASPAGMGIRFDWDDDAARSAFEAAVERLMATELGEQVSARLLGR